MLDAITLKSNDAVCLDLLGNSTSLSIPQFSTRSIGRNQVQIQAFILTSTFLVNVEVETYVAVRKFALTNAYRFFYFESLFRSSYSTCLDLVG